MTTAQGFDRKAWIRLYDMHLGTGAAACAFANKHMGYPTGTKLVALGSVSRTSQTA